jgi:hypothetical protein
MIKIQEVKSNVPSVPRQSLSNRQGQGGLDSH